MSLKSWVLDHVHRMNGLAGRPDLPPREPGFQPTRAAPDPAVEPGEESPWMATPELLTDVEHLGAYGPLIAAIRDELEHFVASHVRLHVVIADRDRFVLTSIGMRCSGAPDGRALLQQFMREFKPEQVKRYLARDVIAGLPNASAIDLSQFAGLFDAEARAEADDGEYRDLIAALRTPPPASAQRRYEVSIVGRWTEAEAPRSAGASRPAASALPTGTSPPTPLVGPRCEFDVVDADGRHRVSLQAVVRGRRYAIGKGEGCDIKVNGTYTSRRHAEVWLDSDGWWVADVGSTNGLRVELQGAAGARTGAVAASDGDAAIRLPPDARIVLSARAEGPPADYPTLAMRTTTSLATRPTPIAAAAAWKTPLTASRPAVGVEPVFTITAVQASGVRSIDVGQAALPLTVGRSRNQTLVVDRRYDGVSGHHLDVVALDEAGADVVVHGDNGVSVDGVRHAAGAKFRWILGQTLALGATADAGPSLALARVREGQ